jgi:hypothetical protein
MDYYFTHISYLKMLLLFILYCMFVYDMTYSLTGLKRDNSCVFEKYFISDSMDYIVQHYSCQDIHVT